MMSDDEILLVVLAHKEGKKIERRVLHLDLPRNIWTIDPGIEGWNFQIYEYHVVPEPRKPREWWIHPKTFPDVEFEKDRILTEQPLNPSWIHVVEVLE